MASGATWMVLFKLLERSIGLCSTIVLARLLVPEDFGLVALATAMIAALELLSAFSFDVLLIQKRQAERSHYDTAWTLNVLVGAVLSGLVLLLAGPAAQFYSEPRLAPVMWLLALAPLVGSLENIGVVAFRKEMQFRKEFAFLLAKKLVAVAVTISLAFTLRNYWALVAGIVTGRVVTTSLSYWVHPFRPKFSLAHGREMANFSTWMYLSNMASFVANKSSDFIVGKFAGPASLGVFSIAYEMSNLPTSELVAPINRAVFPGYAQLAGDASRLRDAYLRVIAVIALATIPAGVGIAATASVFVPLIFGPKWAEAVPLIGVLACFGLLQSLQNNCGSVYYALGRQRTNATILVAYDVLLVAALVSFTMRWGAIGAAFALLCSAAVMVPANIATVCRYLEIRPRAFFAVVWRPAAGAATMYGVLAWLERALDPGLAAAHLFAVLLVLVAMGAATYVATVAVLWRLNRAPAGAETDVLRMAQARLRRRPTPEPAPGSDAAAPQQLSARPTAPDSPGPAGL
jgi:O-antigen/teichoic acid export membrane protein